jgi:putative ABC transport system ATP-binding protein
VAIARALVSDPAIILCDEPTAALDAGSFETVMEELRHLADLGKSVAVVTHDPRLEKYADKIIFMKNGNVLEKKDGNGTP